MDEGTSGNGFEDEASEANYEEAGCPVPVAFKSDGVLGARRQETDSRLDGGSLG